MTAPTPPPPAPRRRPSTLGGLVYLLVVAAAGVGLLVVALGPWRRGVTLIGVALLVGAVMRTLLPENEAGMLRVRRSRWIDLVMLAGVGAALIVLAVVIPDQPG
ncbi:hypothetical protein ASG49_04465 [Marmoricola sp. Leaf446]|uniref:DUF3017 domain-containing protein n=1 Tax=Marmoricola sp. Leaf446 TaxID=1736379 RepID=UPI0006F88A39|nr:DUF3017 domain-containing protein [Marmoricola sp. Leaf446]KQT94168.1 hypothetical protein ASG49_04465 [Marmoricola sp. Leaf446]